MDPQRWQEIKQILDDVSQATPDEREGTLQRACGGDDALRLEVESLLAFDDETRVFLDRPIFDVNAGDPAVGLRIDHYRIVEPLGRGGMGAVYLARREDDYSQEVALKLIQRGLTSRELVARFHEERQILADLDHPSIARLFDGGTTGDGLPYLVMERVEGEPIDRYCDRHRLGVGRRLELFRQVLAAVHFSHQHLVVHRDLKPGNILINADGLPKLIDFGIAKLLRKTGEAAAPEIRRRHRLLSPRYASPEQVRGERVTTASDVYALGVLLYELLAGCHPYRFEAATEDELLRLVCDTEVPLPSVAVAREGRGAEIAAARATTAAKLRRRLTDDLDAIVAKAMRKRPEERYGSVEKLSEDLGRSLRGLPVSARGSSPGYRVRKFVRRHRLSLAAAALALAVAASLLATLVLRGRLTRERTRVEAIGDFANALFRESNPDRADGEDLSARDVLERASARVGPDLLQHPMIQAEVNAVLGRVNQNLGELAEAQRLLTEALRLQREHDPGDDAAVARRANELAAVLHDLGDAAAAESLYREAMERIGGCRSPDLEGLLIAGNLALLLAERGAFSEAAAIERCVRERRERELPPGHKDVASTLSTEAYRRYNQGDPKAAAELFRGALEIRREVFGAGHTRVANVLHNLGGVLVSDGQAEEAEGLLRQALAIRRRLLGAEHPKVASTEKNLARALTALGDAATAEPLARHAVAVLSAGKADWRLADAQSVLGGCLAALGRIAEAEPLLLASYQVLEQVKGSQSPYTLAAGRRIDLLNASRGG